MQVRVLEHIGDACITKLKDLRANVEGHPEIVLPDGIPDGKVELVEHMVALVSAVENNKAAESKLFLKTLKLNDVRATPPRLAPPPCSTARSMPVVASAQHAGPSTAPPCGLHSRMWSRPCAAQAACLPGPSAQSPPQTRGRHALHVEVSEH